MKIYFVRQYFSNPSQLYHGNASLLAESLEVIQQTATVILGVLEAPVADEVTNEELAEIAA